MSAEGRNSAPVEAGREPGQRPDASMSMINDLLDERIEDDYRAARRLRVESPHAAKARLPERIARRTAFFMIVVLCAVVATGGGRQLIADAPKASADHDALVKEAKDRSSSVADLERQLVQARRAYAKAQTTALANDAEGAKKLRELRRLEDVTGFNAVSGSGVMITVDDASSDDLGGEGAGGRILDRDLQILVNGLWASGATAISINRHRLTSLTAIREAGDAVLVDYRPLARPYVVSAIGNPNNLQASFADGPAGRYFKTLQTSFDVRFDMQDRDDLRLPAASSVTLQYARSKDHP